MPTETIEGFPLSLQQKRLWHFRKGAELELISQAEFAIVGPLDSSLFEVALKRVIERHEICRSVFKSVPGMREPVQILEEKVALRPAVGARRLELSPIFDWELNPLDACEHRLDIRFPAVSADYTSLRLFMEDLCVQYQHAVAGTRDESEPMQYLDYTQWQVELQDSPEARASQQFWKSLSSDKAGCHVPLELRDWGFAAVSEIRSLPQETLEALDRMNGQRATVICAAWAAFCARLAELDSEMVIGVSSNGRSFEELQNAVGPYDRILPISVNLRRENSSRASIEVVDSALKLAQQHQEFYSGDLLSADDARGSGFAFQFAYRPAIDEVHAGDITFKLLNAFSHSEPLKLKLELLQGPGSSPDSICFCYNARSISPEYASILADRFEVFLNDFVLRPEGRLMDLPFASVPELELVRGQFARTVSAEPQSPCLLELFRNEVALHPQRPALICGGKILTYGELNARANQLANHLSRLDIRPGEPVAISAERSFEMIVGLLGIQKAGGAYVPLDPGYPKDRQEQVLLDCAARIVVTQTHLVGKLPLHHCIVVSLSVDNPVLAAESVSEPTSRIDPDQAAYIIYTSGSTGRPKGVSISHRKLAASTAARFSYYQEPVTNYLLLSSFAFDSSIAGIFWSLAQGGTLTIPRHGAHQDPRELLALVRDYKVSHLLALPSFYHAILEQAVAEEVSSLRTVIVAGEPCWAELVQLHYATIPKAQLFNEYGPTEGTVWSTVHRCEPNVPGPVPIGRPVPNMSVYILNDRREPVGIGQLGELHIAGPSVADGYLNSPEITKEKFITTTIFGTTMRLYRTGDLARFREDGLIEFHGRIDEQVKIRGYRIEIGEIEHLLARHPDVREAVVIAREDRPGEKRLVAYIQAKDQTCLSIPELRLFAQEKLPQFMVPAQFVSLGAFPLTPNGKVDRKAFPAPDQLVHSERSLVAPRNADEEQLIKIWAEVLKLEEVGVEENFFDLGGHSLLAIQVIARVRDAFKLEIPMAAFFEAPTIGGMAVALGRCRDAKDAAASSIRRVARVAATDDILAKLNGNPG